MLDGASRSPPRTGRRPAAKPVAPIASPGRILLAEDGLDNQRFIAFVLKKAGAQVTIAGNGQIALDNVQAAARWTKPVRRDPDGHADARHGRLYRHAALREQGYAGPIVALTAHAMAADRQECLDAGCDDYITKPIDRQSFLATVSDWAARGGTNEVSSKPATGTSNAGTQAATIPGDIVLQPPATA